jgi:hypothetical protein
MYSIQLDEIDTLVVYRISGSESRLRLDFQSAKVVTQTGFI